MDRIGLVALAFAPILAALDPLLHAAYGSGAGGIGWGYQATRILLASGTLLAYSQADTTVRGAEPALADDAYLSMIAGSIQPQKPPLTIADGLRTSLGRIPFEIFQAHQLPITRVSELLDVLAAYRLGDRLRLGIWRDGEQLEVEVLLDGTGR